ncbi:MAG: hypothetical protein HC845_13690 [Akkermansiaceae bacterium]|nr:hypothetical protein [Akkermansiaceae bacterium]NJR42913.1 hypothetical protein [Akkermansiaceae bacterium]
MKNRCAMTISLLREMTAKTGVPDFPLGFSGKCQSSIALGVDDGAFMATGIAHASRQ